MKKNLNCKYILSLICKKPISSIIVVLYTSTSFICYILPSDVCRFKFQASCEGQMWEFALVNVSTYKCHYTPGSTTSWHHHLSKLFWTEKVRNLYVTFWCQQGAEMSLVSNGSFQKITITTSNQSPIHKIIHQYFLISFASKYPASTQFSALVSLKCWCHVCGTPWPGAISMNQGRVSCALYNTNMVSGP